jgi:3-oxoacyl-[acyl-carrier-protein] synthase II
MMNASSRVLITGMGAVSAAGKGIPDTLDAFQHPRKEPSPVKRFKSPLDLPVFEVDSLEIPPRLEKMRTHALALTAVREALNQAGLADFSGLRVGVALGTTVASQLNDLEFYSEWRKDHSAPMDAVDRFLSGNLAEWIARELGVSGPAITVVNACSSGADAIGAAAGWLKAGLCDIAIAGGADELNRVPLCGFNALGVAGAEACRPFDKNRTGLNLGEGAGMLILETETTAAARGADTSLVLAGYGSAVDAHHLTAPHPEGRGLRRAIFQALEMAGISAGQIAFINAHGTSTRENDKIEGAVLRDLFPDRPVLSTKGYTGHTLGAAGGLEAVFTALGLQEGWVPASAGFQTEDEEIGFSPTREQTPINGEYALSTSLAFGGSNAALVIKKVSSQRCRGSGGDII